MSEIDQQFIEFVVKSLVGKPDAVQVKRTIDEKGVLLELTVDPEDLGRVIGKRGATAQSLRTLLRALGTKNDARYNLKIVDNGVGSVPDGNNAGTKEESRPAADSDDTEPATPAAESDEEEIAEEAAEVVEAEEPEDDEPAASSNSADSEDDEASDRLRKTREELADLDDLDV
ncbi:MAG TPA: KH domain-containing protein [Candidatus Saccharimonadales bacterium]|nr:KH domain-containing protein [Candidatus Saccharimonadales bacterium]